MSGTKKTGYRFISLKSTVIALVFGAVAMLIMISGLHITIPETKIITDPREIMVLTGSALSGPWGAGIIGVMSGILNPVPGFRCASILSHIIAGIWCAVSYKLLVFKFDSALMKLTGWVTIVTIYYAVFLMPSAIILTRINPPLYIEMFGADLSFLQAYCIIAKSVIYEYIITTALSCIILFSLPGKLNQPNW